MRKLTLYTGINKRLYHSLFGLFFGAMAAGGGFFLQAAPGLAWRGPNGPIYGVMASIFLACGGFLGGYFLWVTVDWRPELALSEEGLSLPAGGAAVISWADIAAVDYSIQTNPRNSYYTVILRLKVLDPEFKYPVRGKASAAGEGGAEIIYEQDIANLTLDYKKVLQIIYDHLPPGTPHPPA